MMYVLCKTHLGVIYAMLNRYTTNGLIINLQFVKTSITMSRIYGEILAYTFKQTHLIVLTQLV